MITHIDITELDKKTLSGIKIDPATQTNDHIDYSRVVVKKPWGYEYLIFQNSFVAAWILFIKKDFSTSTHCHPNKKTSLIVLEGEAICATLNAEYTLKPTDGLVIEKGVFHCTRAITEEGLYLIEVETPINKRDLVRSMDMHGRVGKPYEDKKFHSTNIQNYNYIKFDKHNAYYNITKKFGACSIKLLRAQSDEEFQGILKKNQSDTITILDGKLIAKKGNIAMVEGDTIERALLQNDEFHSNGSIEMLLTKKRDSDIRLADYVVSFLEKRGMTDFLLASGTANIHLLDAVGRKENIRHIFLQSEHAITMALHAYARISGKPGVAIISSGAATTNAITGVADMWIQSIPGIIISGQSNERTGKQRVRQIGINEIDIIKMVKPITKYWAEVDAPENIKFHLEEAVSKFSDGRPGPVWIDIPQNIQGKNIDEKELNDGSKLELEKEHIQTRLAEPVAKTIDLLKMSKRPVIIVGSGVRLANASKEFDGLVKKLGIPIVSSINGKDLVAHDLDSYTGVVGSFGNRSANFAVQNADLLLILGATLSIQEIGCNYMSFARGAKKIRVDIDESELKKHTISLDLPIHADVKEFIIQLSDKLKTIHNGEWHDWVYRCKRWKQQFFLSEGSTKRGQRYVDIYSFFKLISEKAKEDDIIIPDSGMSLSATVQAFQIKKGQRLIASTGLSTPGFSVAASIGAWLCNPNSRMICICGDGGAQINVQEWAVVAQHNMSVKMFILDNRGHSSIRKTQKAYFSGRLIGADASSGKAFPDLEKVLTAYGIPVHKIENETALKKNLAENFDTVGPCIWILNVDEEQQIEPRLVSATRPDGTLISKPLEDMYPFMSREKLKKEMVIDLLDEE